MTSALASDPVELVLSKLEGHRRSRKGHTAKCPAHEDRVSSLSISRGDDGRALLWCFAGCTVEEICQAIGITVADLYVRDDKTSSNGIKHGSNGKPEGTRYETPEKAIASLGTNGGVWSYANEDGEITGYIVRRNLGNGKKAFLPVSKHAGGWYVLGMTVPRPLYNLPNLGAAHRVLVGEGEKVCNALATLGLLATTSPHGAKNAANADWSPLAGKEVVIFPDNDEPGEKYADDVEAALYELSPRPTVRRVNLPGLAESEDAYDWLEKHDATEPDALCELLESFIQQAEAREPRPRQLDQSQPRQELPPDPNAYAPQLYHSVDFFITDFRREFLVNGVLVKGQPGVLGGPKKTLKSGVGIDLAISLDTATPFLGFERFGVKRRANVLLLNGESGEATVQETAARIASGRGINPESLQIIWGSDLPQLSNRTHLDCLTDILKRFQTEVLILDPTYLCLLSGVNPDGPQASNLFDMGALYLGFAKCCLSAGTTPILASHAKKKGRTLEALDLDDLAFSGIAEFSRQWILLSRREEYLGDGVHKLWLNLGGSAGHSFLGHLDIEEGTVDEQFGGRTWTTTVVGYQEAKREKKSAKDEGKLRQDQDDEFKVMAAIDTMTSRNEPATLTRIRNGVGLSRPRVDGALERLRQTGEIVPYKVTVEIGSNAKRRSEAFQRRAKDVA